MSLHAAPDLAPCGCPKTMWHYCDCECHCGPAFSRALLNRTFVELWNVGLPEDSPDRRRHLYLGDNDSDPRDAA